jgi:hypothetical protein
MSGQTISPAKWELCSRKSVSVVSKRRTKEMVSNETTEIEHEHEEKMDKKIRTTMKDETAVTTNQIETDDAITRNTPGGHAKFSRICRNCQVLNKIRVLKKDNDEVTTENTNIVGVDAGEFTIRVGPNFPEKGDFNEVVQ